MRKKTDNLMIISYLFYNTLSVYYVGFLFIKSTW